MNDTDVKQLIKDWKQTELTKDYDAFWQDYGDPEELLSNLVEYLAGLLGEEIV